MTTRERGIGSAAHAATLLFALACPAWARAQPPRLDPAWLAPAAGPTCVPYQTGAIQHAVRVDAGTIALSRDLDPLLPSGYDSSDGVRVVELRRTSDLSLVWARVLPSPITVLAATRDGRRVAVGTYEGTTAFDVAAGTVAFERAGQAFALASAPDGGLAISHGTSVDVLDASGALSRTVTISGEAPTVIHAMMLDGECQTIYTSTEARATTLAFTPDGTLLAGASDGSVRVLAADDSLLWTRPPSRAPGYREEVVALEPLDAHAVRAVYSDAYEVTLRLPAMHAAGAHATSCSASELRIATERLGEAASAEPPSCAAARSVDVDASGRHLFVAGVTRVHAASGRSLLVAPTLHTEAGLLVGDEAWLFGIDGTGERWSLGAHGGRFAGALPIPGHRGAVLDVSADGRWVAIGTALAETYGSETSDGYALRVIDTRTEAPLAALDATGLRARFVPGTSRVALELADHGRRAIEIRELPSGARVRRIELASAEYGGLMAADARYVVAAEDAHIRVVRIDDGSERTIDLPPCAAENASLVGDRLALRVYDRTTTEIGGYRIELLDLSGPTLVSLASASGASGHDVELVEGGRAVVYAAADGIAMRLDASSGAASPIAGVPAGVSGLHATTAGWLVARHATYSPVLVLDGVATSTTLLDWVGADDHAGAVVAYELGGGAYVIGHDGHTRATIHAIDGGVVVRTVGGAFSATSDARSALRVLDGSMLASCGTTMEPRHVPGLLEALVR